MEGSDRRWYLNLVEVYGNGDRDQCVDAKEEVGKERKKLSDLIVVRGRSWAERKLLRPLWSSGLRFELFRT